MNNKLFYLFSREKFISWTIEWRFHLTDIVLIDHGYLSFITNFHLLPKVFLLCFDLHNIPLLTTLGILPVLTNCFCCRVHENTSLCPVIENHLKPSPWNHPLRQFCEEPLDSLKFFIRKSPKVSSDILELVSYLYS